MVTRWHSLKHMYIYTYTHKQIYMAYRMFCSIILMSINVAQNKSKPFSRLSLTITWPSPLECTHQLSTDTHTQGVFSIIRPSPLKLSGLECWVILPRNYTSLPAWHCKIHKHTHKLSIWPHTAKTLHGCNAHLHASLCPSFHQAESSPSCILGPYHFQLGVNRSPLFAKYTSACSILAGSRLYNAEQRIKCGGR